MIGGERKRRHSRRLWVVRFGLVRGGPGGVEATRERSDERVVGVRDAKANGGVRSCRNRGVDSPSGKLPWHPPSIGIIDINQRTGSGTVGNENLSPGYSRSPDRP